MSLNAQSLYVPGGAATGVGTSSTSNVGIGTNNPTYKLSIDSGSNANIFRAHTAGDFIFALAGDGIAGSNLDLFSLRNNNTVAVHLNSENGARLALGASSGTAAGSVVETMTLIPTGNVGIGTINPTYKLSIDSGSNANIFRAHAAGDFILALAGDGIAGSNLDLFSLRNNNTVAVHLNSENGARLALGVSTGTSAGSVVENMTIVSSGNVGIGTTNPTQKLSVNGTVRAKEVIVDTGWSDYVFADDYALPALSDVETEVKRTRHLPGIPSADEVAHHGVSLGDMQARLLAKIEEITLHQIAQEKEITQLKAENARLNSRLAVVEKP